MKESHQYSQKIAVIDLGTNTFNLIIADVFSDNFKVIHSEKQGVLLGMGGINKKVLAEDAVQRAINCLKEYKSTCDFHGCKDIVAIGTSAIRDAKNQQEFIDLVKFETDIDVKVISGDEEASWIYKGVLWSYDFFDTSVIMDIGGGSTEFIFADKKGVISQKSLNIGVSRVFQEMYISNPITFDEERAVIHWFEKNSESYFSDKRCDVLVGSSGSFETFYELIYQKEFPYHDISNIELQINDLVQILDKIIYSTQEERDGNNFIIPMRKKMIPLAAIKIKWILNKLQIKRIIISPCSLKEGVLRINH